MKELWCYIKLGFGVYFGYTLAKYTDQFLGLKYNEFKRSKLEKEYIKNDIKITEELAKETNK